MSQINLDPIIDLSPLELGLDKQYYTQAKLIFEKVLSLLEEVFFFLLSQIILAFPKHFDYRGG